MEKNFLLQLLIYGGCLAVLFILNYVYYKSLNNVVEKNAISRYKSHLEKHRVRYVNPLLVSNPTPPLATSFAEVPQQSKVVNLQSKSESKVEGVDTNVQSTQEITGIKILKEKDVNNVIDNDLTELKKKDKSKILLLIEKKRRKIRKIRRIRRRKRRRKKIKKQAPQNLIQRKLQ